MAGRRGPASRPGAARQSARVRHGRSCPAAGSVREERDASRRETGRSARHTNETSAGQRAAACTGAVGRPDRNAARWRIRDGEVEVRTV